LTGDDNYHLNVSADGTSWKEALVVDRSTGVVSLPFTAVGAQPNLLINGDFLINQRAFAFGALADGVYGVDRWKAVGAADLGWNATTKTLTIVTGAIRQVMETVAFGVVNLASQQVTISIEDLTSGNLTVQTGSVSGVITSGSGRRSVTLTLGAGDTGNLAVTLTPVSYPVSFRRVKLELGASATPWQARPLTLETALCQRYFFTTYNEAAAPGTASYSGAFSLLTPTTHNYHTVAQMSFPARMRATPTLVVYSPHNGAAGAVSKDGVTNITAVAVDRLSPRGGTVYIANETVGTSTSLSCHITASSEL
jgi:hypothetical protein